MLVKKHGWKQQVSWMTGMSGSFGTNFCKDGAVSEKERGMRWIEDIKLRASVKKEKKAFIL
jgi:hypothetical protein